MKVLSFLVFLLSSLLALPQEFNRDIYDKGEKIFDNKCSECHVKYMNIQLLMKNFIEENNELLNLKAPTGNEISFRLKSQIGTKDEIEFQLYVEW